MQKRSFMKTSLDLPVHCHVEFLQNIVKKKRYIAQNVFGRFVKIDFNNYNRMYEIFKHLDFTDNFDILHRKSEYIKSDFFKHRFVP